ncbi:hypothetical protein M9H77_07414 [Catharanthus roseus]|uniref:Uncharacterized protein n=1 Tax=Catharanthus roseus TaxID=4058 RepID=A0ACC0BV39_CATRO|nr:hypothetical protein M9H77_07414 [Catharanthus roseus]
MHRSGAPHRASSDDVDGFLTLRVDPLEDGRSTLRAWPNRLTQDDQRYNKPLNLVLRGTQISYSAAIDLVAELGFAELFLSPQGITDVLKLFLPSRIQLASFRTYLSVH